MIKYISVITLFLLVQLTYAVPAYTVDSFSYSSVITEAKTSLRQIDVPLELYKKMQRNDYGDLRVFNSDGQIVPHRFSQQSTRDDIKQEIPLVFYPFSKEQARNSNNIQVIINQNLNQDSGKQSFSFNQTYSKNRKIGSNQAASNEYQYIIENKKLSSSLCTVKLEWTQSKPSSVISFKLESSNNLQNWRSLSRKLTISKLNYGGSKLIHDELDFSCTSQEYLRLTWLKPEQKTHLIKIKGIYEKKGAVKEQWSTFDKPRYDSKGKNLLFESNMMLSISKLELVAPQDGLFYRGTLYSRKNEKTKWRYRKDVSQYRLNMGETILKSNPMTFSSTGDRYWKLKLKTEGALSEGQLPDIRVGWMPVQLYFLAQGKGPFKLAFGGAKIQAPQNNDLNSLIESLKQSDSRIDKVSIGEILVNESYKSRSDIPWKRILLWLVLIIGTGLMGLMAYRLYQQMSEEKN